MTNIDMTAFHSMGGVGRSHPLGAGLATLNQTGGANDVYTTIASIRAY